MRLASPMDYAISNETAPVRTALATARAYFRVSAHAARHHLIDLTLDNMAEGAMSLGKAQELAYHWKSEALRVDLAQTYADLEQLRKLVADEFQ